MLRGKQHEQLTIPPQLLAFALINLLVNFEHIIIVQQGQIGFEFGSY